jgi:sedoheptulokinase
MPLALALDLGTTTTAAVAVDETGRLVHSVQHAHQADVPGLPRGHAEQDPHKHLAAAVTVLRELAAGLRDKPVCLGLCGQMHGGLLCDADRRPLTHVITWQDRRVNDLWGSSGRTYVQEYAGRCDPEAQRRTGCWLCPGFAPVTLFWLKERGQLPPQTTRVAPLTDWVAAELTAGDIVTDRSQAAPFGVYDLERDEWSESLIAAGGLFRDLFPPTGRGGAAVGGLTKAMAESTGLAAGLPVACAIGDNQASVLGSVPQGETCLQITIGTGGQINWPIERFVAVDGIETRPLPIGRFMLVGAGLAGGDAYAWVNRTVRAWLASFGIERTSDDVYDVINRLAAALPENNDGLCCEPFFRGNRRAPLCRGTFTGVATDNFTLGHVARAVNVGIAAVLHDVWVRGVAHRPPDVRRIIGCGNGLQQNRLLAEALEDHFGLPIDVPEHAQAAAYGAALLAGVHAGLWPDLPTAGQGLTHRRFHRSP